MTPSCGLRAWGSPLGKTDDWMPLVLAPWRRGTTFFTPAERGAYLELLLVCWEHGCVPNEDDVLQQLAKCNDKDWKKVRGRVLAKFYERDGMLYNERSIVEKQKANEHYANKAAAGKAGGKASAEARAKQAASRRSSKTEADVQANAQAERQAEAQSESNTTYQVHSPNGEKHPSDVLATKPKRRSQIPPDWQPNDKDFAHATDRNLAPDTVRNLVEPFRDHHIAKQTLSADFSANWRTWVKNHIHYNGTGPWPRDGGSRPGSNVRERQSAVTARDRILAKAGIQREGDNPLRPDNGDSQGGFDRSGEAGYGRIIEADDWQRVPESADGNEGDDTSGTGDDGRSGGAVRGLSETLDGLPRGRGSVRVEDASRPEPLVARVVGAERAAGDSHLPATDDADGLAASAFLKRSA